MSDAVLGGLIGSTLTAIIIRICDMVQKKLEHTYGLKKSYFERKLCVAEAAVSQRYIMASSLMSLSAILGMVADHPELINNPAPDFLENMSNNMSQQVARLSAPVFDAGNAAPLFFSLDEFRDQSTAKKVMELMLSVHSRNALFQFIVSQLASAEDPGERTKLIANGAEVLKELRADISGLSKIIEEGYQQIDNTIASLRTNMKKYES